MKFSEIERPRDFTPEMKEAVDKQLLSDRDFIKYAREPELQEVIRESIYAGKWLTMQMCRFQILDPQATLLAGLIGAVCASLSFSRRNPWPVVIAIANELRLGPLE